MAKKYFSSYVMKRPTKRSRRQSRYLEPYGRWSLQTSIFKKEDGNYLFELNE